MGDTEEIPENTMMLPDVDHFQEWKSDPSVWGIKS